MSSCLEAKGCGLEEAKGAGVEGGGLRGLVLLSLRDARGLRSETTGGVA